MRKVAWPSHVSLMPFRSMIAPDQHSSRGSSFLPMLNATYLVYYETP